MARNESGLGPVARDEAASTPAQGTPESQPSVPPESSHLEVPSQIDPVAYPEAVDTAPPAPLVKSATEPAPRSRVGGVWVAAVLFALVLLLLLIFVLENGQSTEVSFFGQHGHLPEGVALLLAAVCGILLVAIPGTARIIQLRIRDRHSRKAKAAAANAALAPDSTMDPQG
jgi:uncharacterized integral membrane protein